MGWREGPWAQGAALTIGGGQSQVAGAADSQRADPQSMARASPGAAEGRCLLLTRLPSPRSARPSPGLIATSQDVSH